jgi:hypothetical protein
MDDGRAKGAVETPEAAIWDARKLVKGATS